MMRGPAIASGFELMVIEDQSRDALARIPFR
jgi:hypothetical protein